jgi:peptide/nickel transport system substrate-binding protein
VKEEKMLPMNLRAPMSRRGFLAAGSIGATGLLGASMLPAWAQARGGTLNYNLESDPPNFDLLSNTTSRVLDSIGGCYNGLVQYDPLEPNRIIGDLAESWEIAADGLSVTFRLRENVRFHDGMPMTSEDVKFTFDITRAPPEGYVSSRQSVLSAVGDIEAPDAHTVIFRLTRRSPGLIPSLCPNWFSVLPKHVLEREPMKDVVVGTGPFKFQSYSRGNRIELVRNPDYFDPGRPFADAINVFIIPDQATVMAYFRSGQINIFEGMDATLARQATQDLADVADIQSAPSLNAIGLHFNLAAEPWNDVRVRKAATLAIDREAAVAVLFNGDAVLGGMSPPTGSWALDEERLHAIPGFAPRQAPDAIEEARALLAEAGYPDGFSTRLVVRRDDRFGPWGVFLKDQLAKVGIEVNLDPQEAATYTESQRNKDYDLHGGNLSIAFDDPDAIFGNQVLCDVAGNFSQICDAEIDALYLAQSEELDTVRRKALANDLEEKVLGNYLVCPVAFSFRYLGTRKNVHDYLLHAQTNNNRRMGGIWIE